MVPIDQLTIKGSSLHSTGRIEECEHLFLYTLCHDLRAVGCDVGFHSRLLPGHTWSLCVTVGDLLSPIFFFTAMSATVDFLRWASIEGAQAPTSTGQALCVAEDKPGGSRVW